MLGLRCKVSQQLLVTWKTTRERACQSNYDVVTPMFRLVLQLVVVCPHCDITYQHSDPAHMADRQTEGTKTNHIYQLLRCHSKMATKRQCSRVRFHKPEKGCHGCPWLAIWLLSGDSERGLGLTLMI